MLACRWATPYHGRWTNKFDDALYFQSVFVVRNSGAEPQTCQAWLLASKYCGIGQLVQAHIVKLPEGDARGWGKIQTPIDHTNTLECLANLHAAVHIRVEHHDIELYRID